METTIQINKEKLNALKEELKNTAIQIKILKTSFKTEQRKESKYYKDNGIDFITKFPYTWQGNVDFYDCKEIWKLDGLLRSLKYQFRHKHIAYSLMKGKKYEQIEKTVREGNKPNWDFIRRIQNEITS